jgi:anaerobic selenocysteine-containing dehydrogenase
MTRDSSNDVSRRTFIKKAATTSAISLGAAGATAGNAAAVECRCTGEPCGEYPSVGYIRECCDASGNCTYRCECY